MRDYTMNLRLFDMSIEGTMTTGTETLSAEMKIFYDKVLLKNAKPNLVHDQFGQKRPIPKNRGKEIEFRRYKSLPKAMKALTEGVTPNPNKLEVTTITARVQQYGDWIPLSDVLLMTAIDNNLAEAMALLGDQAGRTSDSVTREEINAGTNVLFAPKGETVVTTREELDATALISPALVMKAVAILKGKNAKPIDGSYVSIIHPYSAYDMMMNGEWKDWHKYTTSENMYKGEIGKIGNCRFVESTEAKIWANAGQGGISVFSTLVLGANAYGVTEIEGGGLKHIVKQLGSAGTGDPLDQRASAGWKLMKTAKILSNEYMVRIEHASSFATTEAN